MTEENLNETQVTETVVEETKECNCPVCKVLKSECFKKFLGTVLASFIGCSLALLVFAPKKPPCPFKMHKAPYERMMPMPPMHRYGEFHHRNGMRPDFKRYDFKKGEFKHKDGFKRHDFRKDPNFKRPMRPEGLDRGIKPPVNENTQPVIE